MICPTDVKLKNLDTANNTPQQMDGLSEVHMS